MQFHRLTFVVTVLVMVTFTAPLVHPHPVRSVQHSRGLPPLMHYRGLVHHARRFYRADSDIFKAKRVVPLVIRDAGDDHGDVAAHDANEAQLHKLEAALKHYEEYGDAESLQFYLKGFGGDDGDDDAAQKNSAQNAETGKETPAKKQDDGTKEQVQQQQPQQQQPEQKPKQSQQEDGEDCVDGTDGSDNSKKQDNSASPQVQQPAQSSQPPQQAQPQKMIKKPKAQQPQQPSGDYSASSNPPQPQPQHDQPKPSQPAPAPAPKQPSPAPSSPSSSSNSIIGYTPPPFNPPAGSPSTASLYSSTPFTGRATFYNTGLGACGITNTDDQPIVAISRDLFEQYNPASGNPNHNSLCGKKVEITWNGKKVQAFATDECPGCEKNSLDCSPSVFEGLDRKDKGVLDGISWRFV